MKKMMLCGAAALSLTVAAQARAADDMSSYGYAPAGDTSSGGYSQTLNAMPASPMPSSIPAQSNVGAIEPAAGTAYDSDGLNSGLDFVGPYVGADLGYEWTSADVDGVRGGSVDDADMDGWEGGVFVGYSFTDMPVHWLSYLAIEGGYEVGNAEETVNGFKFEKDHEWLLTARPGVMLSKDASAYGIIGYSNATYSADGDDGNLNGLVLGIGGLINTGTAAKLRLEYTNSNYGQENFGGADFEPMENDVKLGVLFQF
jgi:opacity protein-like surface antigen